MANTVCRLACLALSTTLLAGCLVSPSGVKAKPKQAPDDSGAAIASTSISRVTTLTGIAQAPAHLIGNNSGSLIGNNSSGLVGNNSGGLVGNNSNSYRLLASAELAPLPNAKVVMVDQFRRTLKRVVPVSTDAQGKFVLKNVPVGTNWIIEIQAENVRLATMVRPAPAPPAIAISPASTLVTEHLRQAFADQRAALTQVSPEHFSFLTQKVDLQLKKDDTLLNLADPTAAAASFAQLAAKNKEIDQEGKEIINDVTTATRLAVSKGQLKADELNGPRVDPTAATLTLATYAGTGAAGYSDGSVPANAQFFQPSALAVDAYGNLFVADSRNYRLRMIEPDGRVDTFAGTGKAGADNGDRKSATLGEILGIAVDSRRNIYLADATFHLIRKISAEGDVSTLAGTGSPGLTDGSGAKARFNTPRGLALDASGNLYVADSLNHAIRKVAPDGTVTTVAGNGTSGGAEGSGASARFNVPAAVALNRAGEIFVADLQNSRIRKIDAKGQVTTFAGSSLAGFKDEAGTRAYFNGPVGLMFDPVDNMYVADAGNNRLRKIKPDGQVMTLAGSGETGRVDGAPLEGRFDEPRGFALDAEGALLIADYRNHSIRRLAPR